ncbi:hypothetical protein EON66_09925 [archaeon]|nr:MAG: hypothetical protein EON66_09925 [archaeon]
MGVHYSSKCIHCLPFLRCSSKLSIYGINDEMGKRGWNLNTLQVCVCLRVCASLRVRGASCHPARARVSTMPWLQDPACVHICFTYANCHRAKEFVADLRASVAAVAAAPAGMYKEGSAAIYGMAASIPDKSLVAQVASMFLDTLYKTV